jgi:hypothetical protein
MRAWSAFTTAAAPFEAPTARSSLWPAIAWICSRRVRKRPYQLLKARIPNDSVHSPASVVWSTTSEGIVAAGGPGDVHVDAGLSALRDRLPALSLLVEVEGAAVRVPDEHHQHLL